jgi:uncharacterized protein involved in exopolysaccharide biosynthesis
MTDQKDYNIFDVSNILNIVIKRRYLLIIISIISIIVSSVISLMITPKFKSTHILFPASSASISQSLVAESHGKKDIFKFGEEEDVEQLIQVLQSTEIRNSIINKYDLINHYDIDTDGNYPMTNLYKTYEKNVKISRTEFMSIKIDVLDECPQTAANIANNISELADSTIRRMRKERIERAFAIVSKEFEEQKRKIKEIEDSLNVLSALGVIDVKSQAEVYSDQYASALASGNRKGAEEIGEKLKVLEQYGSASLILKEKMFEEVKKLAQIETKYVEAKIDLEENLPNKYVVDYADVSERKSYPIRWLIVAVSLFSTLLFSLLVLVFLESVKKK